MLVFLAPDVKRLEELERGSAEFLAWKEIDEHWKELNLDFFQRSTAESKRKDANGAVDLRLAETYHWCLVPHQPDPTGSVKWETIKADGQGSLAHGLVGSLSMPAPWGWLTPLNCFADCSAMTACFRRCGGAGYTSVNALWDAFARYPYLPRAEKPGGALRYGATGSEPYLLADNWFRYRGCFQR